MTIKSIEITNVKGISKSKFDLGLIPNKPNLLVAPNGFGKSSFSAAFDSLKTNKLELDDKTYHDGNQENHPNLEIVFEQDGTEVTLSANNTSNNISDIFDVFVINSQLAAKAKLLKIGGSSIAKSSLEISTTILRASIPAKVLFDYSFSDQKKSFGSNGKVLPDIRKFFQNTYALQRIENEIDLNKFKQVRISKIIEKINSDINAQKGTAEQINKWIEVNAVGSMKALEELKDLSEIIGTCQLETVKNETDCFLSALQFINVFFSMKTDFKKACRYQYYLSEKNEYQEIICSFNSTRKTIKPKEDKKKGLIVEWPKAHEISNGQRDVLSFIVLMLKARTSLKKNNCILIIDEIFDYLDDANLISFQYFITNFIEETKSHGRNIYPLLMTHLDPMFFNHFCFNRHKIKVHYLKEIATQSSPHLLKLIRQREDEIIKNSIDLHYFHYHPNSIDLTAQFNTLGLKSAWANSKNFHAHIQTEVNKYLNDQADYDPLAICFGVRVHIELLIYQKLISKENKTKFIELHGTKKKLEFSESLLLDIPESYYLLGIIYNDRLHWKNDLDIVKPVAIKLENLTIKKIIREIFI